jgi:hypothetical protein
MSQETVNNVKRVTYLLAPGIGSSRQNPGRGPVRTGCAGAAKRLAVRCMLPASPIPSRSSPVGLSAERGSPPSSGPCGQPFQDAHLHRTCGAPHTCPGGRCQGVHVSRGLESWRGLGRGPQPLQRTSPLPCCRSLGSAVTFMQGSPSGVLPEGRRDGVRKAGGAVDGLKQSRPSNGACWSHNLVSSKTRFHGVRDF